MEDLIYEIVRSRKRRTLGLFITKEANLEARVPFRSSLRSIKKFVNENRVWIEKKTKEKKIL